MMDTLKARIVINGYARFCHIDRMGDVVVFIAIIRESSFCNNGLPVL